MLGPVFGDPKRFGLDAAFPALFVALLWPMLTTRRAIRAAVVGGATGLVLAPFTPPGVPLAVAAALGLLVSQ
jgi:predicted branched-subunit amino acid permease